MKLLVPVVAAATLLGAVSGAYALEVTNTIKSIDMTKDMVTLADGTTYMAPKSVKLSDFKVGEKVTVDYTKSGATMEITAMKAA